MHGRFCGTSRVCNVAEKLKSSEDFQSEFSGRRRNSSNGALLEKEAYHSERCLIKNLMAKYSKINFFTIGPALQTPWSDANEFDERITGESFDDRVRSRLSRLAGPSASLSRV